MLSGFNSRLTGSSFLLLGLCKVADSFLKSSGKATPGISRPTSHVLPTGWTCNDFDTIVNETSSSGGYRNKKVLDMAYSQSPNLVELNVSKRLETSYRIESTFLYLTIYIF